MASNRKVCENNVPENVKNRKISCGRRERGFIPLKATLNDFFFLIDFLEIVTIATKTWLSSKTRILHKGTFKF